MHTVYFSLGSNLGDKEANIRTAIEKINELVGVVVRQSALLVTQPWGFESEHLFVNAAICCETDKTPREVLQITQQIERDMGRRKNTRTSTGRRTYKDRIIDIDILIYDDLTINEPDLKIPHPLMYQRDFVMIPLNEILL
ncbi:MAG: 2-amino-4-hydroxy-6-hydroxymethyldihydropteridine diphosphokinase [Prevotella sp.]|nr:2-amino-4-hydroxy-6-hydroxymethyldihydropteridine diphosphokinase [Prevotella sp.]